MRGIIERLHHVGEPCSTDEMVAEEAADTIATLLARLRESTELLEGMQLNELEADGISFFAAIGSQIAANEAALKGVGDE